MKAQNQEHCRKDHEAFGLVASGIAGAWEVAVDETVTGTQRWFAQIDGPSFYLYFQIPHPRAVEDLLHFLEEHVRRDDGAPRPICCASPQRGEFELPRLDGNTVSFIWDDETNERCFILVSGAGESRVRVCVEGNALREVADALRQLCDELSVEGHFSESP